MFLASELLAWIKNKLMSARTHRQNQFNASDFSPPLKTQLLILQPTPFCNLDCDYCYLPDRNSHARMSLATVRRVAEQLREDQLLNSSLTIIWHAGEPLVVPVDFYQAAFDIFTQVLGDTCHVTHSIQTNATLINDDWCCLFSQYGVRVGVSIDGPEYINDKHRKTRQGKGSFVQTMQGIDCLRKHELDFHVISVVTADSLMHADVLHAFLLEQNFHDVGFNFDEAEGCNKSSTLVGHEDAHNRFFESMLQHQMAAAGKYRIRELANAAHLITNGLEHYQWQEQSLPVNAQTMPLAIITVAWNGDFSTFSPELIGQTASEYNHFILGNVAQMGFWEATKTSVFLALWRQIQLGTNACQNSCAYFNYCGGGAPANKWYENGTLASTETLYCRSMLIRPFEVVLNEFEIKADKNAAGNKYFRRMADL